MYKVHTVEPLYKDNDKRTVCCAVLIIVHAHAFKFTSVLPNTAVGT